MSKDKSIIIKKVKKVHGGGHHGGAWKVAYADFVTAMMAFFLLLWLLSMVSDEKRARLSAYFKYFSLYDSGGVSWMGKSSEIFGESGENKQKVFTDKHTKTTISNEDYLEGELRKFEEDLKNSISQKIGNVKDQVLIDEVDEGIRIQLTDAEGSLMFEKGSTKLTSRAKEALKVISEKLSGTSNRLIIEGHTDSLQYAGGDYSNWELSTERASSARKALESTGLDPKRIARVAGYADTDPLIKDNPRDSRNRRISITIHVPKKPSPTLSEKLFSIIESEQGNIPATVRGKVINEGIGDNRDYDSIITEGQLKLKNRKTPPTGKTNTSATEHALEKISEGIKSSENLPVIQELANPVFQ